VCLKMQRTKGERTMSYKCDEASQCHGRKMRTVIPLVVLFISRRSFGTGAWGKAEMI